MNGDVEGERRRKTVREKKGGHMITKAVAIKKVSLLSVLLLGLVVSAISLGGCHWGHNRDRGYYRGHDRDRGYYHYHR